MTDDLARALSAETCRLADAIGGTLSRIRVRSGDTSVEVEWGSQAEQRAAAVAETPIPDETTDVVVRSPMVGTFYHCPEPGGPPFVSVGGVVTPDTVIGIIEAMKLMNRITAGSTGLVRQVLVPDGGTVEFEQSLMVLEPPPLEWSER